MRLTNSTKVDTNAPRACAQSGASSPRACAQSCPLWLREFEQKMPEKLAVLEIQILMKMTASAMKACARSGGARLEVNARSGGARSRKSCLREYQRYTVSCLENRSNEELAVLRKAMYRKAYAVGRLLGSLPGLSNDVAKTHLIKLLYRNIGIRIMGSMPGEIRIPRCSFSRFYTPQMCAVMSGMDAGIICGIFGGGALTFSRRLTEGCPACMAVYRSN